MRPEGKDVNLLRLGTAKPSVVISPSVCVLSHAYTIFLKAEDPYREASIKHEHG
jgi:hypothetical protein